MGRHDLAMIKRTISVGSWVVDFLFATKRYDIDGVLGCLYDAGAPDWVMREAEELMQECDYDCGFTFSKQNEYSFINNKKHRAVVLIGPTSSSAEFLDTLTHEVHHLAVAIAQELGVDLEGESPAYIAGDSVRALAEVVCELGCPCCRKETSQDGLGW